MATTQGYYSLILIVWCMKLQPIKSIYEGFSKYEKKFDFSNYSAKSKYYYDWNLLVVVKMEGESGGAAIEESVRLKPKMYFFLVY